MVRGLTSRLSPRSPAASAGARRIRARAGRRTIKARTTCFCFVKEDRDKRGVHTSSGLYGCGREPRRALTLANAFGIGRKGAGGGGSSKRRATQQDQEGGEERKNLGGLNILRPYFSSIVKTMQDFGVGRRSIWEGGVGLFIAGTICAAFAIISWVMGTRPGRYLTSYNFNVAFPVAYGLSIGTPVRMRGVNIGSVVGIKPSITSVDAVLQIKDEKIAIPKDAKIEINQLGLIAETMIDITPKADSNQVSPSIPLPLDPRTLCSSDNSKERQSR